MIVDVVDYPIDTLDVAVMCISSHICDASILRAKVWASGEKGFSYLAKLGSLAPNLFERAKPESVRSLSCVSRASFVWGLGLRGLTQG